MSDRRRPKWIAPVIALVVVLGVAGYVTATQLGTAPAATAAVTAPGIPKPAAYAYAAPSKGESQLDVAGSAYAGANGTLGTSGGTAAVPIASISKLITALVILDKRPLASTSDEGPTLTFSKVDSDLYDKYYVQGASVEPMKTNSSMSEQDALKTMLVASACNYADAVSTWAYGSQGAFLSATKAWLTAHSLSGTTMVEPTGLDDRNTSTPADLVAIGKLALANPVIAAIVALPHAQVANIGLLENTNELLGTDGVNGIKTGTLDAGSDLLFSSSLKIDGSTTLSVIGVILEGSTRETVDADAKQMLASVTVAYRSVRVVTSGASFGKITTSWGQSASVVAQQSASLTAWSNAAVKSSVALRRFDSAVDGDVVGTATYTIGAKKVSVPLILKGSITPPDWFWKLTHPAAVL
ncbi:MAG: D-alanyl-D-alanine carboxypeptidase [Actinomycetota bacterium]